MREIKFKRWCGDGWDGVEDFSHGCPTLVQFTGLKDKNGKEIYEGDILHLWADYGGGNIHEYGNWEVFWRYDRWHLRDKSGESRDNGDYYQGDEVYWESGSNHVEVIGNIYENPELLKK